MGQFVGQQLAPITTLGIIGILLKKDIAARGKGARLHGAIEGVSVAACMDTDIRKICAKTIFHLASHTFTQWATASTRTGDALLNVGADGAAL